LRFISCTIWSHLIFNQISQEFEEKNIPLIELPAIMNTDTAGQLWNTSGTTGSLDEPKDKLKTIRVIFISTNGLSQYQSICTPLIQVQFGSYLLTAPK
jgi:hypothetical protein